jgi:hypothetical protein
MRERRGVDFRKTRFRGRCSSGNGQSPYGAALDNVVISDTGTQGTAMPLPSAAWAGLALLSCLGV